MTTIPTGHTGPFSESNSYGEAPSNSQDQRIHNAIQSHTLLLPTGKAAINTRRDPENTSSNTQATATPMSTTPSTFTGSADTNEEARPRTRGSVSSHQEWSEQDREKEVYRQLLTVERERDRARGRGNGRMGAMEFTEVLQGI